MKVTLLACCLALVFSVSSASQTVRSSAAELGWLAGCWQLRDGQSVTDEQWMKPLGGTMLGISRTVKDGKAAWYESTRIEEDGGSLAFIARPSSAKEDTAFKLVKKNGLEWTFENPANEFPQRVIYRSIGRNAFFARIEGMLNGKAEATDFSYKRVRCE
jgi:hypothetical protein